MLFFLHEVEAFYYILSSYQWLNRETKQYDKDLSLYLYQIGVEQLGKTLTYSLIYI